jgi:hypothetical protein
MFVLLCNVDEVIGTAPLLSTPQPTGKWHDKVCPFHQLSPPWPSDDDNFGIHAPQPSIRDSDPTPRPSYSSLPLASRPEEQSGDNACYEANLLQHVNEPVLGSSDAFAILSRAQP